MTDQFGYHGFTGNSLPNKKNIYAFFYFKYCVFLEKKKIRFEHALVVRTGYHITRWHQASRTGIDEIKQSFRLSRHSNIFISVS